MVSVVKDICIFMIIVQAVLCFAPGSSYEKYIRILVGILMILRITEPIFGFFLDGEAKAEIQNKVTSLQRELETQQWEMEMADGKMGIYSSIEEELKRKLTGCAAGYEVRDVELSGADSDGNTEFKEDDFRLAVTVATETGVEGDDLKLQELYGNCLGIAPEKVIIKYIGPSGR